MITPVTHLTPITYIRRARMLPDKGQILVSLHQRVNATDIVAEAPQIGKHRILNVQKALDLWTGAEAEKRMTYKVGEKVEKGDILAQTDGFLPRVVRSPVTGEVVAINHGQIIIEHSIEKLQLAAGIPGVVAEILPERGVVIECNGALIQGVWGNTRISQGNLRIVEQLEEEELTPALLMDDYRGSIVFGGFVNDPEVFERASDLSVRGLVLSSMTSSLASLAMKMKYPIILMEGFGQVPVNDIALKLMHNNEKRDVSLNAEWDPTRGEKPEICIPLPAQGNPALDYAELVPGKVVRVTVPPYTGQSATLVALQPGLVRLPNGKRTMVATIRLSNRRVVNIPIANIDVLE